MSYAAQILQDDFVWTSVMAAIAPLRKKKSHGRFISICCPMCSSMGETPDKRFRCGIKNNSPGVGVHCFNCGFKTRWRPGMLLTDKLKKFLIELGTDEIEVKRLAYKAFTIASLFQNNAEAAALAQIDLQMTFAPRPLPSGAASFEAWAERGCVDPNFLETAEYLFGRGSEVASTTTYYWTPEPGDHELNRRVIIPFYHEGSIVGWTGRSIDKQTRNRYQSEVAADYLFNNSFMYDRKRAYIVLVEGVFDALAIDGVGTMGARLNERQMAWIDSFGKQVIVVPDRDDEGQRLIDAAIKRKWKIAFPALCQDMASQNWWHSDVKDTAEAVKRYGRLYTLTSILKSATDVPLEINLKRKVLV